MKRILILFLVLSLVLSSVGCGADKREAPLYFYYRTLDAEHNSGLIGHEKAEAYVDDTAESIGKYYFSGPQTEELRSPFPKGTSFLRADKEGDTLHITVSSALSQLTGVNLSLALSCISLTFSQLEGVGAVSVSADGALLGGQESVLLRNENILLEDNSLEIAETKITVYYANSDYRYLIPVTFGTKLENLQDQAVYALQLLLEEPEQDNLRRTLPKNTEILDLSIESGLCIVDFSHDFFRNKPITGASERMTVLSIVNTLTQFDEISEVQFYVEGESLPLYSNMDLSLHYVRDDSAIGPVRTGLNEVDASLFVLRSGDGELAELPIRIKSAANETDADALISLLLSFEDKNGYISAIPDDTQILSLTVEGYHCHVDLNSSFASNLKTENEQLKAVYALVSTLTSLESIRWVSITINGKSEGLSYVDLTKNFR